VIGASFVREIQPGEMLTITKRGRHLDPTARTGGREAEAVYLRVRLLRASRHLSHGPPGSHDETTHGRTARGPVPRGSGHRHGVPGLGRAAAEGYAKASVFPCYGLVKNRYIGRTFIAPDQNKRAASVRRKLNPLRENIEGQRLIVVDDSIVRGTTTQALVKMLRDAGAKEVHLRISSPPFMWPCYFGIDTPTRDDLLAATIRFPR